MLCVRRPLAEIAVGLPPGFCWDYNVAEVLADGSVHGLGIGLAAVAAVVLAIIVNPAPDFRFAASLVYAAALLAMLSASAAYNLWRISRRKWYLRRLDHAAVFVFIAAADNAWVLLVEILR